MKQSSVQIAGFHFRPTSDDKLELVAYHSRVLPLNTGSPLLSIHIPHATVDSLRRMLSNAQPTTIPVAFLDDDLKTTEHGQFRYDGVGSLGPDYPWINLMRADTVPTPVVDTQGSMSMSTRSMPEIMREEWNLPLVLGPMLNPSSGHQWTAFLNQSVLDADLQTWVGSLVINAILLLVYDDCRKPDSFVMMIVRESCTASGMPYLVVYGGLSLGSFGAGLSCILFRSTDGATQRVHFGRDNNGKVQLKMGEIAMHPHDVL